MSIDQLQVSLETIQSSLSLSIDPRGLSEGTLLRISVPDPYMYKPVKEVWRSQLIVIQSMQFCLEQSDEDFEKHLVRLYLFKQEKYSHEVDVYMTYEGDLKQSSCRRLSYQQSNYGYRYQQPTFYCSYTTGYRGNIIMRKSLL